MILSGLLILVFTQIPIVEWTKTYGGSGIERCWGGCAQQTIDGGYVIAGATNSFGNGGLDVYIVKTDSLGDTIWTRTYGGQNDDECTSIQQTNDNGYIIVGCTESFDTNAINDIYILKLNAIGDTEWTKVLGGSNYDMACGVEQIDDNGYIVAGYTYSYGVEGDVWLIKTNYNGDTLWSKLYGGPSFENAFKVRQTRDRGYIIAAMTNSYGAGSTDAWIIKTDSLGDTLWTVIYGGPNMDKACDVLETSDTSCMVVGWTYSYGSGYDDIFILKINKDGDTLWSKIYGHQYQDGAYSIKETTDHCFIIAGTSEPILGNADMYFMKVSDNGDLLWATTYGGSYNDMGWACQQTMDGGYMIAGQTESFGSGLSDFYLVKTDSCISDINDNERISTKIKIVLPTIIRRSAFMSKNIEYNLIDIYGRKIISKNIPCGIYFIENKGEIIQKIIIIK